MRTASPARLGSARPGSARPGSTRPAARWLLVVAGVVVLLGVSVVPRLLPAAASPVGADELRSRVLASANVAYQGYAESTGELGLPELPQLDQVAALLSDTTRTRIFYAGPQSWRADALTASGERDTYHAAGAESVWDYSVNQLTEVVGDTGIRLPRAADLLPPELARRLLGLAPNDPVTPLPARRVAGVDAAGLRLTPADPDTTVAHVDIWADPTSGLPVQVEVAGRGQDRPVLVSQLLDLDQQPPDPAVLWPAVGPDASVITTTATDLAGILRLLNADPPPATLAGRSAVRTGADLPGVGTYGTGLAGFVLLPLSRDLGGQALSGARNAGGADIALPGGQGVLLPTPLLTVLVVRSNVARRSFLLVGTVNEAVLRQAAAELSIRPRGRA